MQSVSRPLIIGGAAILIFSAIFLSGSIASNPWNAFFMLSALILVYIAALNFSDKTNHTGSGSTAGVIQYQSKGDTTENIQEEEDKHLPDPLEQGFDLPL